MFIFDFNAQANQHPYITIEEDTVQCSAPEISQVIFRNYPLLRIDDVRVSNCRFENCKLVYFSDCAVQDSQFEKIETLRADRTNFSACSFAHLYCDNDCILSLEDTNISGCRFQDVALRNEAFLVVGVGDVWIDHCDFENVRADQKDGDLFSCAETIGTIFKRKKAFCIVDEESCTGLNLAQTDFAPMNALDFPIDVLDLTVRTFNCLARAGFKTVGDLVHADAERIQHIPNIGKRTISEVANALLERHITDTAWASLQ